MLEAEGAVAARCPLVRIAPLEDPVAAQDWIARLIAEPFDYTVLLTGEGLRQLLPLWTRQDALIAALGKTRLVVRGPKPVRALREIGLSPALVAGNATSQGVLEILEKEELHGRTVGLQLYPGDGALALAEALRTRGARIFPVTPYRYATDVEDGAVADVIRGIADGRFGLIAFTASAQLERLFQVAKACGLTSQLETGLARTPIAAIGPVMEQALAAHGLKSVVQPQASFHLKPLVRAIVNWRVA
jgi:uroporphyrinogen-III synthase